MMLAIACSRYKVELRADLQQYYGLNLDVMGHGYTLGHAADLVAALPHTSRIACRLDPANAWGLTDRLLASIANSLRWLQWSRTRDGARNRNMPAPIVPPAHAGPPSGEDGASLDLDEYKRRMRELNGR